MVAGVHAVEDAPREPVAAVFEDGRVPGTGPPTAALELVQLVARLCAEQLRQIGGVFGDQVHHHHLGVASHPVGAVLVRDAHEEARRVDVV